MISQFSEKVSLINNIKSVTTLRNNNLEQKNNIQQHFVLIFSIVLLILIIFLLLAFLYINRKIKAIYLDFRISQNLFFNKLLANVKTENQDTTGSDKETSNSFTGTQPKLPAIMSELNDREAAEAYQELYQNTEFEGNVDVHVGMDRVDYHRTENIEPVSLYSEQAILPFTNTNYSDPAVSLYEETDDFKSDHDHVYSEPSNL